MKKLFENAYFGKVYRTRDGRKAIYLRKNEFHNHILSVGSHEIVASFEDGSELGHSGESIYDIVSEWQEPINEREFAEYAGSVSESYWSDDMETFDGNPLEKEIYYVCKRCYKAGLISGFHKALERNNN